MKNIIYSSLILILFPSSILFSQEIADKKMQAGLTGGFGLNLTKMGTSKIDKNGVGTILNVGVTLHKSFKNSKNLGIATGLEFDFESIKYKAPANTNYYYNDTRILQRSDVFTNNGFNMDSSSSNMLFALSERTQKPVYITIPVMLLFRTDFIGDFRYFGKFGIRNSFLASNKINDNGQSTSMTMTGVVTDNVNNENMSASGDMFFYRGSVGFTGGAEWNFTGSTSLLAEIGFFYGITPIHWDNKEDNRTLFNYGTNSTSPPEHNYFSNKSNLNQLILKVALLF